MDSSFIIFLIVLALAVLIPLNHWNTQKRIQFERKRQIEAQMRQDITDRATQKKVAAKILREAGKKP